ncbi:MAG: putative ABC transport system permease protein [Arcticibacterium sp.]|jgi:putative ABC transport system permease protein
MTKLNSSSKAGLAWIFKMAWRDGKASGGRLILFMSSIVLGIAAVVSVQSFSKNLENNIQLQSKALMGADFLIDSNELPSERVQIIMDSLGGANGREISFNSMAAFPSKEVSKFIEVRGIGGDFPLYGVLETIPIGAAAAYKVNEGALVDATLMLQFDLQIGDSVKIGEITFPILGSLKAAPGSNAISTTVAPPIIIPYETVGKTGLIQLGSRKKYNYYFSAKPEQDIEALDKSIDAILDSENADFDSHTSVSQRLGKRYDNFAKFLNLVAFIALLLGCVGIASSVHIYVKEKLKVVAVLKCIGATRQQTFSIFLVQIAILGLIGGLLGTCLGLVFQGLFPLFIQALLPFEVQISLAVQPIIMGLMLGVSMSVLFALFPLLSTWYVSPLEVLRVQNSSSYQSKRAGVLVLLFITGFILLFSFWLLETWASAFGFVLVILTTFAILYGVSSLFMWSIKKFFPVSWSFTGRQSLLNLFRPNNQTMVLVLAIGLGSFLISTLYFTKDILLSKTSVEANAKNPNVLLLDVQANQREALVEIIRPRGLEVLDNIPIVTMRLQNIKGIPVKQMHLDTNSTVKQWILHHEFRTTYRDTLIGSESIAEGKWPIKWKGAGPVAISLSDNVAYDAQVALGDTMVFNVQGVLMETVVGNIRAVDWGRAQLNFSVLFPTGVLENAPQFNILTTNVPDEATSAALQQEIVQSFPNITVIDLRQVLDTIQGILDQISWVINFMAFFSILTGIIVLIGSVRTSKYQRIRESVLLRTLGAKSNQILRITALEYLYLGGIGTGIGIFLSLLSSQLLAYFVFDTIFRPSWIPFLVLLPGVMLIVLGIGLFNSRVVIRSSPLEVLRKAE